ncbi:MAG: 5-(carboxyamino)imidazole ribonucleotide synthase [Planctomycetes bacterium]|nr:5-(carboxyamino)imidazole ribonucleotide synthase [Planctomycetota bacterium]
MKIGIVGGGQLGQMLAQAGKPLGHSFKFLVPPGECCVESLGEVVRSDFADPQALADFARGVDVFTFEWENVPLETLEALARFAPMRPSPQCAAIAKDRIREKQLFQRHGLHVQKHAAVSSAAELSQALEGVGLPAMLKTRGLGYDGKGQQKIDERSSARAAFERLGSVPCILEAFVPFDFEISLIAVRGRVQPVDAPAILFYPACRNRHVEGILRRTVVPAEGVSPAILEQAQSAIRAMMETLDYEGVLCVEFFVQSSGAGQILVANEMAPRVHNSGHWSIEGAETSQFTNHIKAITRQPLGSTALRGASVMINLVGAVPSPLERPANAHVHLYGKSPRAGRKLGHITAVGADAHRLVEFAFNGS